MTVQISAIVCTYNRSAYLRKAVQSLADQTLAPEMYEIIIVDNGSEDNTLSVIDEFSHLANMRYIHEPAVGLSKARNTGWRNARGKYIALLDDDAVAQPEWLKKLLDVFKKFDPTPGSVGGRCEPIWESDRPNWLPDEILGHLSIFHWSNSPIILSEEQWLSACNIAYPRKLLQVAGGFREDLGRQGNSLRGGEENYLRRQLDAWGYVSVYHPEIIVFHHIPSLRLSKKWFRKAAYWQGLSEATMQISGKAFSRAHGVKLSLARISWTIPRLLLMIIAKHPTNRFRRQFQVIETIGYISGLWKSRDPL